MRITSNPDSLAALAEEHDIFAMFAVEPMGNTCNCTQNEEFLTTS